MMLGLKQCYVIHRLHRLGLSVCNHARELYHSTIAYFLIQPLRPKFPVSLHFPSYSSHGACFSKRMPCSFQHALHLSETLFWRARLAIASSCTFRRVSHNFWNKVYWRQWWCHTKTIRKENKGRLGVPMGASHCRPGQRNGKRRRRGSKERVTRDRKGRKNES